ncbi:hypothetical protein DF185_04980 [Marinifilum breve]|uniref:Nuclear transport factor 2 family protein n=1 Tax=Marinifilum breve TaxID=2184082 RepID=A0A2V4A0A1_9BACT|nr:nuclear transport factor 2 family protein [Marinifilum breve]PXY02006.1 hypothetical protein DF185_04980 [Marinifilum breve]
MKRILILLFISGQLYACDKSDSSIETEEALTEEEITETNDSVPMDAGVKAYFDAVAAQDLEASVSGFADNISVNIAGMRFNGTEEVRGFIQRDVIGGIYTIEKVFNDEGEQVVHCLFQPEGWNNPEPPIEYRFTSENDKVIQWTGKYR